MHFPNELRHSDCPIEWYPVYCNHVYANPVYVKYWIHEDTIYI